MQNTKIQHSPNAGEIQSNIAALYKQVEVMLLNLKQDELDLNLKTLTTIRNLLKTAILLEDGLQDVQGTAKQSQNLRNRVSKKALAACDIFLTLMTRTKKGIHNYQMELLNPVYGSELTRSDAADAVENIFDGAFVLLIGYLADLKKILRQKR